MPFEQPLALDVRTVTKLAEATDPTSSSLAVFADGEELFIWGMVDQELRHADYVALDSISTPRRPGMFQTTIVGVGNLCVYKDFTLLGSLEQNNLVQEYYDVMWSGPVHDVLKVNLQATLAEEASIPVGRLPGPTWHGSKTNCWCAGRTPSAGSWRASSNIGHGGGLLIVPSYLSTDLNVKYNLTYDRLPKAVVGLTKYQLLKRDTAEIVAQHCRMASDVLPVETHVDAMTCEDRLDEHKSETLGCVRFIAALSRVDGFVLLDKSLVVHGFGVELPHRLRPGGHLHCRRHERDAPSAAQSVVEPIRDAPSCHDALLQCARRCARPHHLAGRRRTCDDEGRQPPGALGEHQRAVGLQGRESRCSDPQPHADARHLPTMGRLGGQLAHGVNVAP